MLVSTAPCESMRVVPGSDAGKATLGMSLRLSARSRSTTHTVVEAERSSCAAMCDRCDALDEEEGSGAKVLAPRL